jgi:hypothetical protein
MEVLLSPACAGKRRTIGPPDYAAFSKLRAAQEKALHTECGIIRKSAWYRAANWIYVGETQGSAKRGSRYYAHGRPKAMYLLPLHRRFRELLRRGSS